MKNKIRKICFGLFAVTMSLCLLFAIACDDGEQKTENLLTLNKSELSVTVRQTANIEASYDGTETVTWVSDDASIATVSGGAVTGVKAGSTIIKATAGEAEATCVVTVTEMQESLLSLSAKEKGYTAEIGDERNLEPVLSYDGRVLDGVSFEFKSSDDSIVEAKPDGTVKAVAVGSVSVVITATIDGYSIKLAVPVTVNKNVKIDVKDEYIQLYTQADVEKGYKTSGKIQAELIVSGQKQENPNLTFTVESESQDVITLAPDGTVTALNAGEVDVKAYYAKDDVAAFVTVVVSPVKITLDRDAVTVGQADKYLVLDYKAIIGDDTLVCNKAMASDGIYECAVPFEGNSFDITDVAPGRKYIEIYTRNVIYRIPVNIEKGVLYLNTSNTESLCSVTDETVILTEDIDMSKTSTSGVDSRGVWKGGAEFSGTFDGNGYSITGLTTETNSGLFKTLNNATVKNLKISGKVRGPLGLLCTTADNCTFENLYIELNPNGYSTVGGICQTSGNITVKNVIINVSETTNEIGFIAGRVKTNCTVTIGEHAYMFGGNGKIKGEYTGFIGTVTGSAVTASDIEDMASKNITDYGTEMLNGVMQSLYTVITQSNIDKLKTATTGYYILGEDINMSGITWAPTAAFTGILNGNGHAIKNLTTNGDGNQAGLFKTFGGTIKNIAIIDVTQGDGAGVIAMRNVSGTTAVIENVVITVNNRRNTYAGGMFRLIDQSGTVKVINTVMSMPGDDETIIDTGFVAGRSNQTIELENCYFIGKNVPYVGTHSSYGGYTINGTSSNYDDLDAFKTAYNGLSLNTTLKLLCDSYLNITNE